MSLVKSFQNNLLDTAKTGVIHFLIDKQVKVKFKTRFLDFSLIVQVFSRGQVLTRRVRGL